jgi:hypothetical protein
VNSSFRQPDILKFICFFYFWNLTAPNWFRHMGNPTANWFTHTGNPTALNWFRHMGESDSSKMVPTYGGIRQLGESDSSKMVPTYGGIRQLQNCSNICGNPTAWGIRQLQNGSDIWGPGIPTAPNWFRHPTARQIVCLAKNVIPTA